MEFLKSYISVVESIRIAFKQSPEIFGLRFIYFLNLIRVSREPLRVPHEAHPQFIGFILICQKISFKHDRYLITGSPWLDSQLHGTGLLPLLGNSRTTGKNLIMKLIDKQHQRWAVRQKPFNSGKVRGFHCVRLFLNNRNNQKKRHRNSKRFY